MPLYLTDTEREAVRTCDLPLLQDLKWALLRRVDERASKPGLLSGDETADWWRPIAEYLCDGAMAYALKPTKPLAAWLRDVTLSLCRRPQLDWIGPDYRGANLPPELQDQIGHLETAHFNWGIGMVLDLAPDVFEGDELDEAMATLRERGGPMCLRWVERTNHLANWRCVLTSGVAAAGAVTNDKALIDKAVHHLKTCNEAFQPDGSYSESLQYGNYAAMSQMMSHESLRRRDESLAGASDITRYVGYARWAAYSFLYSKALTGWGSAPRSRSLNFNDCGAAFRPSAEVLLHIASRAKNSHPVEAGLARWIFEQTYSKDFLGGPYDQMSFGLRNHFGALTLPLLTSAAEPLSPEEAGLPELAAFSCGDTISRDTWGGRTVVGFHGGGDPLYGPGHLHGDLNSFILVHNDERLLVDPGHSCYRNLLHKFETDSETHNTCTFVTKRGADNDRMEDQLAQRFLQQAKSARRLVDDAGAGLPPDRGGVRLLAERFGDVSVIGSDAARLYGRPLDVFSRFVVQCGTHVVFVIDRIEAEASIRPTWNWLLNNRDGQLDLKLVRPDRLVARRGTAGMKLFHLAGGTMQNTVWAHVHDAYHCMPGQLGEGKPGSGVLVRFAGQDTTAETYVHAIAVDRPGPIAGWHLREGDGGWAVESPNGEFAWSLKLEDGGEAFHVTNSAGQQTIAVSRTGKHAWTAAMS